MSRVSSKFYSITIAPSIYSDRQRPIRFPLYQRKTLTVISTARVIKEKVHK